MRGKGAASTRTVRVVVHELELDPHDALERDVLDYDILADTSDTLSDPDFKDDLRVDLLRCRSMRHVGKVVRRKRDGPLHHDNVFVRVGEGADVVDVRRFRAERKGREAELQASRRQS